MEEAEAGKVWDIAHGRYDIAMKRLVADVLQEAENPEDKLFNALMKMRTPESTKRAAEAIQKGYTCLSSMHNNLNCDTIQSHLCPQLCYPQNA